MATAVHKETGRVEAARNISAKEIDTYAADGVVLLKNAVSTDLVERLRRLADANLVDKHHMHQEWSKEGDKGRFFSDTFLWARNDEFRDIIFNSPLAEIASRIMKSKKVNLIFDQFLIKEPNTLTPTYWHHDTPYWPVAGRQVCTLWLALDHVTANTGAVEYVKSSHQWNVHYRPPAFKPGVTYSSALPEVPDIDSMRQNLHIVQYELEPGDCTAHDGLTLHGGPGNHSKTERRRAYITRWAGDDVVYAPKPDIKPMLRDPGIPPGSALDCDLFPAFRRA